MFRRLAPALVLLSAACSGGAPRTACGVASLSGPTMLLAEFATPGQTLGLPPDSLPPRLVARMVAGPAFPAIVGRTDSGWVIGVEGTPSAGVTPGFGVLVLGVDGRAHGVLVYEGTPIALAPVLGTLSIGPATVPLLGIQVDQARYEVPGCPVFPDSVLP